MVIPWVRGKAKAGVRSPWVSGTGTKRVEGWTRICCKTGSAIPFEWRGSESTGTVVARESGIVQR